MIDFIEQQQGNSSSNFASSNNNSGSTNSEVGKTTSPTGQPPPSSALTNSMEAQHSGGGSNNSTMSNNITSGKMSCTVHGKSGGGNVGKESVSSNVSENSIKSRRGLGLPLSIFFTAGENSALADGSPAHPPGARTSTSENSLDLEGGRKKTYNSGIGYHSRCADPDDPDLPPHLSEYMERNVIAVLNRCDPERYRRCYSCGYDNTDNSDRLLGLISHNTYPNTGNGPYRNNTGNNSSSSGSNRKNSHSPLRGGGIGAGSEGHSSESSDPSANNSSGMENIGNTVNYYWSEPTFGCAGYDYGWNSGYSPVYNSQYNNGYFDSGSDVLCNGGIVGGGASQDDEFEVKDMDEEEILTFDARLLSEAFLSSGRIDHTIQLMAYHPDYLKIFLRTHHFLLRGDGPLPYHYRNYIAIMAAARYQCSHLMELQKREFLLQGGDPKWLRGLESAPTKLTSLYNINKMMAHRPWVLKKEDFLHLTKKSGWSLSEVVQAVVLLAHFHSLSSFIHGCGITPEIDFDKGHSYLDPNTFNVFGSSTTSPIGGMLEGGLGIPGLGPQTPSPDSGSKLSLGVGSPQRKSSDLSSSVSFAADPTAIFPPPSIFSNSSSDLMKGRPTKSILKKTDIGIATTPTVNSNHHTNHHHHHLKSSNSSPGSLNASNTSPTAPSSNLLKPATHHNSYCGAASPPKKGLLSGFSEVETIMATMKNLSETSPIEDPEERKKRFEKVASCDDTHEKENVLSANQTNLSNLPPEVSPFICDPEFTYEDFAKRGHVAEMHTFRIQDYSWEEHGFSLVNRLYADVGGYIDEKFKVAQNMTYYTMGGRAQVDTTKFRTAVWNYIQCLYGIRHDDYDYGEVNQLLERPLKSYIKTVCCYPERVTKADYDNVMREFKHSEKVHVNLMIMEAKFQAELLYALRTIMRFIL